MFKKLSLALPLVLALVFTANAQETDYSSVGFDYQLSPSLPQYADYKSFDIAVLTTKAEADKPGTGFSLPYKFKIGSLQQVDSTGDFHIVSLVQKYGAKMNSPSTAVVSIALSSNIYNKFGNLVKTADINNDQFPVDFGRVLTKQDMDNQDVLRRLIMEKILEANLRVLADGLFGAKLKPSAKIASLDGVKKKPELQEFDVQVKALKTAVEKEGLPGFKKTAEPFMAYWEKMSTYSGEGDVEEVKRAALHNLALYNIAAGNTDKAQEYIEQYKPIDKQVKEMFGLIKYKNSEELEKLIATLYPVLPDAGPAVTGEKVVTMAEVVDAYKYLTVNGTATISGKKIAGTYTGVIKVNKLPSNSFGNIASLDPENIVVTIHTKDESGQPKTITTTISKVEELKDNNGSSFISQKFGTSMLGSGSYYVFMQSTFTSPKVTVYRTVVPAGGTDYVVKKAGDDKGVKSSMLNARKNLEEYLNDCSSLAEKMKNGTIDKKVPVEKIAEEYNSCK